MEPFFLRATDGCWICRNTGDLSGEHKFKASSLRTMFDGKMSLVSLEHPHQSGKIAQGPKSNLFKFRPTICTECNSRRTQIADQSFDKVTEKLRLLMRIGANPELIANLSPWSDGTSPEVIGSQQYFAKFLGCIAAEKEAPIPFELTRMALGQSSKRLDLVIYGNEAMREFLTNEKTPCLGHDGLAVTFDDDRNKPTGYRTGIFVDWALISSSYRSDALEVEYLQDNHAEFLSLARAAVDESP